MTCWSPTSILLTTLIALVPPSAAWGQEPSDDDRSIAVVVRVDGAVLIAGTEIDQTEIPLVGLGGALRAVAEQHGATTEDRVFVFAPDDANYSDVIRVMVALRAAGFENIMLANKPSGAADSR